jgi:hypothetical protein
MSDQLQVHSDFLIISTLWGKELARHYLSRATTMNMQFSNHPIVNTWAIRMQDKTAQIDESACKAHAIFVWLTLLREFQSTRLRAEAKTAAEN